MSKSLFTDEETYKKIVEQVGFIPTNLRINPFTPKGQVIMVDDSTFVMELKKLRELDFKQA